jgi:hypothetical protein
MSHADLGALLHSFAQNTQLHVILYLWIADLVLGVLSAVITHMFRLSYLADTLRNDGLKVLTWFVLFALGKTAPSTQLLGTIDLGTVADGVFVGLTAAFVGSILSSIRTFGIDMPTAVAGDEKNPTPPVNVVTTTTKRAA